MMKNKILIWILAVFIISSFVSASQLSENTYSYYKSDEGATGNLVDVIATAHHLSDGTGVPSTAGIINTARGTFSAGKCFTGTSPSWANGENYSISIWINRTGTVSVSEFVLYSDDTGTQPSASIAYISNNTLRFHFSSAEFYSVIPTLNVFSHVVVRMWANRTYEAFVNNVFVGSATPGATAGTMDVIGIGCLNDGALTASKTIVDEIGFFNYSVSENDITSLYNGGSGRTYPFASAAPVINNATYNLTTVSAGQNSTAWRGNISNPIKTLDTTPTVTFNTTLNAYCRINKADQNWTTMGNDRNCTTTGNTSHTCTLPAADLYVLGTGYNSLFIGCTDATFTNETFASTSGALNLSLGFTPTISALQVLPDPAYVTSVLNCSFWANDTDSPLLNVSLNWSTGSSMSWVNVPNGTFLNHTITGGFVEGDNVTCFNVDVYDGETNTSGVAWRIISNTAPSGFSINSPTENQTVFANSTLIQWSCSDVDNDTRTAFWFVNGSLNGTSTNNTAYNLTGLAYDVCYLVNATCGDGSSNTTYVQRNFCTNSLTFCNVLVSGLVSGYRYQDNVISAGVSCAQGVPVSACSYSINDFAPVTPLNCSAFNISAELGWNRINMSVNTSTNFNSTRVDVWAKKYDSDSFADYAVIVFTLLITVAMFVMGGVLRSKVFFFMTGVGGLVVGYEMLAFSMVAGLFVVFCSAIFSLAVMFRKGG